MNIAVFCSAYVNDEEYVAPAGRLAWLIGSQGHSLVWGGSHVGIMKVIADGVRQHGGKIYGVSVEAYKHRAHKNADEMIIAKDLGERKAAMLAKSDALIVLPGGLGTLDELTEVLELKKQAHHNKPVAILNINGFYDGLLAQLTKMHREGFIPLDISKLVYFANDPDTVMRYLR